MSRNKIKALALGTAMMTVPLVGLTAAPADAASVLQFGRIQYDAPGTDTTSNFSINGEYFSIRNTGLRPVNLNRWTVLDAHGNVYRFGNYLLPGNRTVFVRSGFGVNTSVVRYWNRSYHVWGNTFDRAYLRSPSGLLADTCSWNVSPFVLGLGYTTC